MADGQQNLLHGWDKHLQQQAAACKRQINVRSLLLQQAAVLIFRPDERASLAHQLRKPFRCLSEMDKDNCLSEMDKDNPGTNKCEHLSTSVTTCIMCERCADRIVECYDVPMGDNWQQV
jgi:hypothetical protein